MLAALPVLLALLSVASHMLEQRYLSVADAASYLGLSAKTVYSWAEKGAMPAYKVGRLWRFDKTELDEFVRKSSAAHI